MGNEVCGCAEMLPQNVSSPNSSVILCDTFFVKSTTDMFNLQ